MEFTSNVGLFLQVLRYHGGSRIHDLGILGEVARLSRGGICCLREGTWRWVDVD